MVVVEGCRRAVPDDLVAPGEDCLIGDIVDLLYGSISYKTLDQLPVHELRRGGGAFPAILFANADQVHAVFRRFSVHFSARVV